MVKYIFILDIYFKEILIVRCSLNYKYLNFYNNKICGIYMNYS